MKISRESVKIIALAILFALWLVFVYWNLENGFFSKPVLWALGGAAILSLFSIRELKEKIEISGQLKAAVTKTMRRNAEIFSLLAVFFGASALIQIAGSIEHQQTSKTTARLSKVLSTTATILDENRCNKFPWTQYACKKAKDDLGQLFFEVINDKKSELSINRLVESIKYQYKMLSDEKSTVFKDEEFTPITEVLDSIKTDPVSTSYTRLYLGLATFFLAFLAATRKVALSLV
jgi:hypothetical protein